MLFAHMFCTNSRDKVKRERERDKIEVGKILGNNSGERKEIEYPHPPPFRGKCMYL